MWRRWEQARQLIRQHGVSFNVYGDARGLERPWPLDPVPVVMAPDEFAQLAAGLAQRATLLDRLLADIYGPRRVIAEGLLPPEVVLAHPGLLRACAGHRPAGRAVPAFLRRGSGAHARRATCGCWPIGRRRRPGAGYALENRIVLGRVLPEAFRECHAQRLAPFFRTLRDTLAALAPHGRENPRIVLLTAGPLQRDLLRAGVPGPVPRLPAGRGGRSDRARRARLPEDAGRPAPRRRHPAPPQRRLLRSAGAAAGLAAGRARACCRRRATATSRSPTRWAAGVVQTPALIPFLPSLCRALLGEELQLPSVETWWCGEPDVLAHVLAHLREMVMKPAYPTGPHRARSSARRAATRRRCDELIGARCGRRRPGSSRSGACAVDHAGDRGRTSCSRARWCCAASWSPTASTATRRCRARWRGRGGSTDRERHLDAARRRAARTPG